MNNCNPPICFKCADILLRNWISISFWVLLNVSAVECIYPRNLCFLPKEKVLPDAFWIISVKFWSYTALNTWKTYGTSPFLRSKTHKIKLSKLFFNFSIIIYYFSIVRELVKALPKTYLKKISISFNTQTLVCFYFIFSLIGVHVTACHCGHCGSFH